MYMYMCNVYCMTISLSTLESTAGSDVHWTETPFFFVDTECLILFITCLPHYVNMYRILPINYISDVTPQ